MKSILLASASVVAFAGAAAAEVTFTGSANLGYNSSPRAGFTDDANEGFYSEFEGGFTTELGGSLSTTLDNGITVGVTVDLDQLASGTLNNGIGYELVIESETSALHYGDTAFAAETRWDGISGMAADNFSEADGEEVLRGDFTYAGVDASLSYVLADNTGMRNANNALNQLSLGANAEFGMVNVGFAYQEASKEAAGFYNTGTPVMPGPDLILGTADDIPAGSSNGDFNDMQVWGISLGTSYGGGDFRIAYADNSMETSVGLSVVYPVGPVTLEANYADNSVSMDEWDIAATYADGPYSVTATYDESDNWGIEGSYDVGNGLVVYAGVITSGDDYYVAGEYDLGGDSSLVVSYAEDADSSEGDEIGANAYQDGTTVEVAFEF